MHEHVKVEPGAHRWLPSRTSGLCVNPYARVSVMYVQVEAARTFGSCPSRECRDTLYLTSEYPALKPTITLFGSRLSAIPPPRTRYTTPPRNAVKERRSPFKHSGRKINIFDKCISHPACGRAADFIAALNSRSRTNSSR